MKDPLLGCYTVEKAIAPATLFFEDLPQVYKDNYKKEIVKNNVEQKEYIPKKSKGKTSALFDLKMSDLVSQVKPRDPHPVHNSEKTGGNFSLSDDGNIAHCWRCLVTLNPIQFLAVKSREYDCLEAGTPHKGARKTLEPKMIFYAWRQAKLDGVISEDDPIPAKALQYIAHKHKLINYDCEKLPRPIYYKALKIVEDDY